MTKLGEPNRMAVRYALRRDALFAAMFDDRHLLYQRP
jgi:hypothetical protein